MTREIKYRAYDKDVEKMWQWDQVQKIEQWWIHQGLDLMQYTGLKDRTGKEIYEGDVVQFKHPHAPIYNADVQWIDNGYWLVDSMGSNHLPNQEYREIIGNIYQNKEFLPA